MKTLFFILLLVVSTSTLASPWAMQNLRNQKEVKRVELNERLRNERQRDQLRKQQLQNKFQMEQEPHYRKSPVFRKSTNTNSE